MSTPRSDTDRADLTARVEEARAMTCAAAARCRVALAEAERRAAEASRMRTESRTIRSSLEDAVRVYARALRTLDTPPERALVLVKDAVGIELRTVDRETRPLMEDVARWCIEAYYAT